MYEDSSFYSSTLREKTDSSEIEVRIKFIFFPNIIYLHSLYFKVIHDIFTITYNSFHSIIVLENVYL